MPNQSSNKGHIALRSCVICKKKIDHYQLLNFFIMGGSAVFDLKDRIEVRKYYLCDTPECKIALAKWLKRHHNRHLRMSQKTKR
ncbi:MAG: DUF448 domain-containing protein [Candidatus Cloacimonetes bacterium HGW-Cloacimonetes-1]|nr:MAG: DUF448 domain-containing protein [Candidatus Cloacimonetes bacterium HGW-Cloacimonetes-1]